jgi:hypothetical protein
MRPSTSAAGTPCWASWARRSASSSRPACSPTCWHLSSLDFLDWGWRFPFYVAFAINVVALFARLRLVTTHEYSHLLDEHQLDPVPVGELMSSQAATSSSARWPRWPAMRCSTW